MSNMRIEEIDHVRESEDNADLSNPNLVPPEVDTSLVKLYDDIRITVRREAGIISSVFPQPATVMQVLLQRIFAQSVIIVICSAYHVLTVFIDTRSY